MEKDYLAQQLYTYYVYAFLIGMKSHNSYIFQCISFPETWLEYAMTINKSSKDISRKLNTPFILLYISYFMVVEVHKLSQYAAHVWRTMRIQCVARNSNSTECQGGIAWPMHISCVTYLPVKVQLLLLSMTGSYYHI